MGTVGSRGLNQQAQEQILESFRAGQVNVLVATCIAEEGLDIGEVDLIVCYDSVSSPLRLMQRMGRTGRKRSGRVVMLVVEGKRMLLTAVNVGLKIRERTHRQRCCSGG